MSTVTKTRGVGLFAVALPLLALFAITIALADGPTPPPTAPSSMTVTASHYFVPINGSNVTITATAYNQTGGPYPGAKVYFNNSETNLGTLSGGYNYRKIIWADNSESYEWYNYTGTDGTTTIILTPGATIGTEKVWVWIGEKASPQLQKTISVVFTSEDVSPPLVANPSANPATILNDNGRPRAAGTNRSQINVTVTDDAGVMSVTINLSAIGGSATQPMTKLASTNVWTVTTNASTGINATHALTVNATDIYGKVNNTVKVNLEVRRRGDVVRDNVSDLKDALYIARYTVWLEPEASNPPTVLVGDVVGAAGDPKGDGKVDMKDVLYLAKWVVGQEQAP